VSLELHIAARTFLFYLDLFKICLNYTMLVLHTLIFKQLSCKHSSQAASSLSAWSVTGEGLKQISIRSGYKRDHCSVCLGVSQRKSGLFTSQPRKPQPPLLKCQNGFTRTNGLDVTDTYQRREVCK